MGGRLSLYGLVNVGVKPNAQHSTHPRSSFTLRSLSIDLFAACLFLRFFPPFFARFFNHGTLTLTFCPPSRISLFPGDRIVYQNMS
jgi:hypothetical protein